MEEVKEFLWLENPDFEEEECLMDSDGNVILTGDYYHDKIRDTIGGFIEGLKYAGWKVKVKEKKGYWEGCYRR